MSESSPEHSALRVLSGEDRSLRASLLRGALRMAEPVYAGAMSARNSLYTSGILPSRKLPGPTVSVGNLTTGGTGKTPMVRWLAEQLIARNKRPAVLMRGYGSDEPKLLRD